MPHLLTTLAVGFTLAWVLGLLTQRIKLSPIVGYLIAGVLIGPHTPGFVGNVAVANQLAEVGVILLMFGVGLHFHWKDLAAVRAIAVPGALGQSLAATLLAIVIFAGFGLPLMSGAVIGMAISVASTVVLMRVLADAQQLDTPQGHAAVGWLLVEDVLTVIVLVIIPVLPQAAAGGDAAAAEGPWLAVALALLKLAGLVAVMAVAGTRAIPWVLVYVARFRSRELFTLTVLVFSIAIATASHAFFGASMALGAFLAGMVVAQSPVSQQAAADALPLRDAFAVLFFVSVGMMFDPAFLIQEPWMVLAGLGIVVVGKPLIALLIVAAIGHPARTGLTVAIGLAQIGEFSFILSDLARVHGVMPESGHNILVAAAILSITINPVLFRCLPATEAWLRRRPLLWNLLNGRAEKKLGASSRAIAEPPPERTLAIVVGYGPAGRSVDRLLRDAGLATVVIDLNMDTVVDLLASGRQAVFGDASREPVLQKAGIQRAKYFVVTVPTSSDRAALVLAARGLNATLRIFVRAHYLSERRDLEQAGATAAVFEEAEAAVALARLVLADTGASRDALEETVRDLRLRLMLENLSRLGTRPVRSVMVPWQQVHCLRRAESLESVLHKVARMRYSRWPVVADEGPAPIGYLLAKDLVTEPRRQGDWLSLVRPIPAVDSDADTEKVLQHLQQGKTSLAVVMDGDRPIGLVTAEDIVEQVVGRMEDEYHRRAPLTLCDAVLGDVVDLEARSPEAAISELVSRIPRSRLPAGADIAALAAMREREASSDLGCGAAVPQAPCAGLGAPIVVIGRSLAGIPSEAPAGEPVRLLFLLVTPAEEPEVQVGLLSRIAAVVAGPGTRERLLAANSAAEVLDIIAETEEPRVPAAS